jgi:DNA-directed RNA polymerase subunit RPC12/RpoP
MNDVQNQFIAVCRACSASLKVSFNKLGQQIACPQCHHTFVAGEAFMADNQRSCERPALPARQPSDQVDRIDAVCTHCHATLRVRRAYIGNDVRCKYCDEVFRVREEGVPQLKAKTNDEQPDPRQTVLQVEHEQLYVAHNLLQADHDRLKTEYTELRESLRAVTTELESIRAALGTISPEDVGTLANERQSLAEEVHRLREEILASLATQTERDQLVAERQRWVSDLDWAHSDCELLTKQLRDRDDQLEAARAAYDRLSIEWQTALTEVDQLRLAVSHSVEATHHGCNQLHSARIVSNEIEAQPESTNTAILGSGGERHNTALELEGLRAQVAELSQRLDESEQSHREMAEVLEGIGIRCRTTRV